MRVNATGSPAWLALLRRPDNGCRMSRLPDKRADHERDTRDQREHADTLREPVERRLAVGGSESIARRYTPVSVSSAAHASISIHNGMSGDTR